ncbi:alpha/beta hydrolase [Spongiactinospora rosea]|uniref:Alpha/beta hydrolase n=1 Tax=Spongiactinospora rosea TaxID=2248750 RepID=A0A366LTE2_9ACTN|nr:alpha/beta hydrolase [Spongiactinospora rosea]RBQ17191.1 alpha/beta hydrolase [Spongiactinospora rosea]
MTMKISPVGGAAVGLLALLAVLPLASSAAASAPAAAPMTSVSTAPTAPLTLPRPTGAQPVGAATFHLVDRSRPDPWVPAEKARQLMVSVWYPAKKGGGGRTAQYMTGPEAQAFLEGKEVTGVPKEALSEARTHAVAGARPAGRKGTLPLVVLSPGFTLSRASLTGLAEELASHGYVVAGIDHVHESHGTSLPGGRLAGCVACVEQEADIRKFGDKAVRSRQADVSFVLDRLLGRRPVWNGARLIDRSRIGMAGHSLGGAAASWTMLRDKRVLAGINMDGAFHVPVPEAGLKGPFMLMGAGEVHEPGGRDTTWARDYARMTGWKRWITVEGGDHGSFTDYPLVTKGSPREVEITRAYVKAFMDRHLRGADRPVLDGPSTTFPEVKFWK